MNDINLSLTVLRAPPDQREKPWHCNLTEVRPREPDESTRAVTHFTVEDAEATERLRPRPHILSRADGGVTEFYKLSFSSSPHFWVQRKIFFGNTHQSGLLTDDSDCCSWNANREQKYITENISPCPLFLFFLPLLSQTHKTSSDYRRRRSNKRQRIETREQTEGERETKR